MIIQRGAADDVRRLCIRLHSLYPNEALSTSFQLLDRKTKRMLTEPDGSPIRRLTIVGHGGTLKYVNFTPEVFSENFIRELNKLSREDIEQIHSIDLLGCFPGMLTSYGTSFAGTFVQKLVESGYHHIQIKAFTNMSVIKPHPIQSLMLEFIHVTQEIRSVGIKTEDEVREYSVIGQQIAELKKRHEELCLQWKQLDSKATGTIEELEINQTKLRELRQEIEMIDRQLEDLNRHEAALYTIFVKTHDPRKALDTDPQCHFTTRYQKHFGIARGVRLPIHDALTVSSFDREKLDSVIRAEPSTVNIPDPRGFTPLFIASGKNNAEGVEQLIKYGADPRLVVNILMSTLQSILNEEGKARLERLISIKGIIHAKEGAPAGAGSRTTDEDSIFVNPLDMAYLNGHSEIFYKIYSSNLLTAIQTQDHTNIQELLELAKLFNDSYPDRKIDLSPSYTFEMSDFLDIIPLEKMDHPVAVRLLKDIRKDTKIELSAIDYGAIMGDIEMTVLYIQKNMTEELLPELKVDFTPDIISRLSHDQQVQLANLISIRSRYPEPSTPARAGVGGPTPSSVPAGAGAGGSTPADTALSLNALEIAYITNNSEVFLGYYKSQLLVAIQTSDCTAIRYLTSLAKTFPGEGIAIVPEFTFPAIKWVEIISSLDEEIQRKFWNLVTEKVDKVRGDTEISLSALEVAKLFGNTSIIGELLLDFRERKSAFSGLGGTEEPKPEFTKEGSSPGFR